MIVVMVIVISIVILIWIGDSDNDSDSDSGSGSGSGSGNGGGDVGKQLCRVENFVQLHKEIQRLCLDRVRPIVSQLFGEVK